MCLYLSKFIYIYKTLTIKQLSISRLSSLESDSKTRLLLLCANALKKDVNPFVLYRYVNSKVDRVLFL